MENFFYNNTFYCELENLIEELELYEIEQVALLPNDWQIEVYDSKSDKMFSLDKEFVVNSVFRQIEDSFEDRFPDEDYSLSDRIQSAIRSSIDINKLNSMIPEMYYPLKNKTIITKTDLIEYIS